MSHVDSPVGRWRQYDDRKGDLRSIIRIEQRDGELVGVIEQAFTRPGEPDHPTCVKCPGEFHDRPIVGLRFMWGLRGNGQVWDGGSVLDPEEGKIYRVRIRLADDGQALDVRGYIGVSLFGRTQRWLRERGE